MDAKIRNDIYEARVKLRKLYNKYIDELQQIVLKIDKSLETIQLVE